METLLTQFGVTQIQIMRRDAVIVRAKQEVVKVDPFDFMWEVMNGLDGANNWDIEDFATDYGNDAAYRAKMSKLELALDFEGRILKKDIYEFSKVSASALCYLVKNMMVEPRSMITLTYPANYPANGELVKKHLHSFLMGYWDKFSDGFYIWFLEFQKRGAPHFHILVSVDLSQCTGGLIRKYRRRDGQTLWFDTNQVMHNWVSERWAKIVATNKYWRSSPQDYEKHRRVGCSWEQLRLQDAGVRYVLKHFSKKSQKQVPQGFQDVGRFWGASRNVRKSIVPIKVLNVDALQLEKLLERLDWSGLEFYRESGFFPKVLFDVGEQYQKTREELLAERVVFEEWEQELATRFEDNEE